MSAYINTLKGKKNTNRLDYSYLKKKKKKGTVATVPVE